MPAQPSYGEGMREALEAQVALLKGGKVGEADFTGVGKLEDLVREYEAPLRKTTAQIDTDVLRQTLLGEGSGEVYTDDGKIITGYESASPEDGRYIVEQDGETVYNSWAGAGPYGRTSLGKATLTTRLIDTRTGNVVKESSTLLPGVVPWQGPDGGASYSTQGLDSLGLNAADLGKAQNEIRENLTKDFSKYLSKEQMDTVASTDRMDSLLLGNEGKVTLRDPIYKQDPETGGDFQAAPGTFTAGQSVRAGTGMVDLVGDSRAIKSATKQDDYESYVRDNEGNMAAFQAENTRRTGLGEAPMTVEQWGKAHYEASGKAAGDKMPTKYGYAEEDPGRRAGFDPSGEFLGLSAFGEDIQAQNLSRQRQRDLEDVARLSPLYSDIMEKYKPGTQEALEDARGVLKAREGALTGTGGSLSDASTQVRESYLRVLGREPDAAGLASWTEALQQGASVEDMNLAFAQARAGGDAGPVMEGRLQAQARSLGRAASGGLDTGTAITAPGGAAPTGYGAATVGAPGALTAATGYGATSAAAIDPLAAATGYAPSAATAARDLTAPTSYTADTGVEAGRLGGLLEPDRESTIRSDIGSDWASKVDAISRREPSSWRTVTRPDGSTDSIPYFDRDTPKTVSEEDYNDLVASSGGDAPSYADWKRGYTESTQTTAGTSDIRTRLMEDAYTGLGEGLTAREQENIEQASRRRATALGRAFDRGSIADEVQSRVLEDRNRQAQNRAYAQQVLGQEAGLQTSDMGRSLQAQLANQQAANQAASMGMQAGIGQEQAGAAQDLQAQLANQQAINRQREFGIGAGLQQEQAGAQFAQQKALSDQQAANQAAQYGVGAGLQQESLGAQMAQQKAMADAQARNQAAQYGVGAGLQQQQFGAGQDLAAQAMNREAAMKASEFDILQNVARGEQNIGRELAAAESDMERDYRQRMSQEQLAQQGTLGYIDAATRLAALEDTSTLDPFQAVLNRAGGGSLAAGNQLLGTAQYGLQSGPQYLNPSSGLGFIQNQATNQANMFNAQQAAGATRSAGIMGGVGTALGGLFGGPVGSAIGKRIFS
jgi:hypothetical protein